MIRLLRWTFTWWHGRTWGVMLRTWRHGQAVGVDALGGRYYQDKRDSAKRWVVYSAESEAASTPPMWRLWLGGGLDEPPQGAAAAQPWLARAPSSGAKPRPAGWQRPASDGAALAVGAAVEPWTPDMEKPQ